MAGGDELGGDPATETFDPSPDARGQLALTVVHHPDQAALGTRVTVTPGQTLEIGRHSDAFGPDALARSAVSRRHASIECSAVGDLTVVDHGSRNGTFVNGGPVKATAGGTRLSPGDVVRMGRLLVVAEDSRGGDQRGVLPGSLAGFVGFSVAWTKLARVGAALVDRDAPVLIWGPSGGGRSALAAAIAEPHETVTLRQPPTTWPTSGVVVLEDIEAWPTPELQRWLDPAGQGARRIVVTAQSPASLAALSVPSGFLSAVAPWTLHVPPLAERPSDLAALVWEFARRFAGQEAVPSHDLLERLLRTPMAAHTGRLESFMERAVLEGQGEDGLVDVFDGLDAVLASAPGDHVAPTAPQSLTVARSGAWLELAGAPRADLTGRPLLRRLAVALTQAWQERPGTSLDVDALFAAGWPGDRTRGRARTNRVYVALTKLRKLGLAQILIRIDGGYRLDPGCAVDVVDDAASS